jgi:hypothetical protein
MAQELIQEVVIIKGKYPYTFAVAAANRENAAILTGDSEFKWWKRSFQWNG